MGQFLASLYPVSYFLAFASLIVWSYFQKKPAIGRIAATLFAASVAGYGLSVLGSTGTLNYKFGILFRDLVVLGVGALIFSLFSRNTSIFAVLLLGLMTFFGVKGFNILQNTFPQTSASANNLDPNAELLVEVKEAHQITELQKIIDQYQLDYKIAFRPSSPELTELDDYFTINIPDGSLAQLADIRADLQNSGLIDWVEENEVVLVDPFELAPAKKSPKRNFGINDPGLEYLWAFDVMEMDQLYQYLNSQGIKPVKKAMIAILDTGVDANHEDLKANYKSINKKYDSDKAKHGTHCAGIAAAVTNNKVGIASFSTDNNFVEVSSIKVLSDSGSGTQAGIINGIIEAADRGTDVISLSLGGLSSPSRQRAYNKAVEYANGKGAILVVAAGNSNSDANRYAPANAKGVIVVSAIDPDIKRADFSNFVNNVDLGIAAPGVAIYSTVPGNEYDQFSGTSMATPQVAGLLGLMKSLNPDMDTDTAYRILSESGKATESGAETGNLILPAEALKRMNVVAF